MDTGGVIQRMWESRDDTSVTEDVSHRRASTGDCWMRYIPSTLFIKLGPAPGLITERRLPVGISSRT